MLPVYGNISLRYYDNDDETRSEALTLKPQITTHTGIDTYTQKHTAYTD